MVRSQPWAPACFSSLLFCRGSTFGSGSRPAAREPAVAGSEGLGLRRLGVAHDAEAIIEGVEAHDAVVAYPEFLPAANVVQVVGGEAQESGIGVDGLIPQGGPAVEGAEPVVEPAGNADASAIDTLLWNAKGKGVCTFSWVGAVRFLGLSGVEETSLPGPEAGLLPRGPVLSAGFGYEEGAPPGPSSFPPGAGCRGPDFRRRGFSAGHLGVPGRVLGQYCPCLGRRGFSGDLGLCLGGTVLVVPVGLVHP